MRNFVIAAAILVAALLLALSHRYDYVPTNGGSIVDHLTGKVWTIPR